MKTASGFEIELEKGEALKKFYELTEEDLVGINERLSVKLEKEAKEYGLEIVTADTVNRKKREQKTQNLKEETQPDH